jgi:hypothetical protein
MKSGEMIEIRRIRKEISKKYANNPSKLLEHYKELEANLRTSGKYKFADSRSNNKPV